jgi:hypothetical protein
MRPERTKLEGLVEVESWKYSSWAAPSCTRPPSFQVETTQSISGRRVGSVLKYNSFWAVVFHYVGDDWLKNGFICLVGDAISKGKVEGVASLQLRRILSACSWLEASSAALRSSLRLFFVRYWVPLNNIKDRFLAAGNRNKLVDHHEVFETLRVGSEFWEQGVDFAPQSSNPPGFFQNRPHPSCYPSRQLGIK